MDVRVRDLFSADNTGVQAPIDTSRKAKAVGMLNTLLFDDGVLFGCRVVCGLHSSSPCVGGEGEWVCICIARETHATNVLPTHNQRKQRKQIALYLLLPLSLCLCFSLLLWLL